MQLHEHGLPEREGGGGAPLVCALAGVRMQHKRAGAGDRPGVGTGGLGCSCGVPLRGTPQFVFIIDSKLEWLDYMTIGIKKVVGMTFVVNL